MDGGEWVWKDISRSPVYTDITGVYGEGEGGKEEGPFLFDGDNGKYYNTGGGSFEENDYVTS